MFADVEQLLVAWLPAQATAAYGKTVAVGAETGPKLLDELPFVQAARIAGSGDHDVVLDEARVSVHCFEVDRPSAQRLSAVVRSLLVFTLPGVVWNGAVVSDAQTLGGPAVVPYDNTFLRRVVATYQLTIKRPGGQP